MLHESLDQRLLDSSPKKSLNREEIEGIITWFEHIRTRPLVFCHPFEPEILVNGLYWFHMAFQHMNCIMPPPDTAEKRGWETNALGPIPQMREKGLTTPQIIDELLVIEINAWTDLLKEQIVDS